MESPPIAIVLMYGVGDLHWAHTTTPTVGQAITKRKAGTLVEIMLALGLAILLMSNIWLLREHEKTRSRLDQYRAEVSALDDRIYQILLAIDLRDREERPEPLWDEEGDVDAC